MLVFPLSRLAYIDAKFYFYFYFCHKPVLSNEVTNSKLICLWYVIGHQILKFQHRNFFIKMVQFLNSEIPLLFWINILHTIGIYRLQIGTYLWCTVDCVVHVATTRSRYVTLSSKLNRRITHSAIPGR